MTLRLSKCLLVLAVAFYYTLVAFNNVTDFSSNYEFVHHVLLMDTTFPGNRGMWRALHPLALQYAFYGGIILWETATAILCWWGGFRLLRARHAPRAAYSHARRTAVLGLTLSLLMWLVAFLTVGGEWFLMWQSHTWNGQDAAFRMFTVVGIILVYLVLPDGETIP
ncbi:MAG TPA: DUF2165 domain-containing protein [Acidobacteriaceae bacterium]